MKLSEAMRLSLMVLLLENSGCSYVEIHGWPKSGRVLEVTTNSPISDVLIIAEWHGSIGGPVHSSHVCYHLEITSTGPNGEYKVPGWIRGPVADWESGLFGLRDTEVILFTYKAGFSQGGRVDPNEPTTIFMHPINGISDERRELLSVGTGCGRHDDSFRQEVRLWDAICEEAKTDPGSEKPLLDPRSHNQSLKQIIDRNFQSLGSTHVCR